MDDHGHSPRPSLNVFFVVALLILACQVMILGSHLVAWNKYGAGMRHLDSVRTAWNDIDEERRERLRQRIDEMNAYAARQQDEIEKNEAEGY